jgi:hypothetical protein
MVRYDSALVQKLPSGTRPISFPSYLDSRIPAIAQMSEYDLACELWFMREYYFSLNDDQPRKQRVIAAAIEADPSLAGADGALLESQELSRFGWSKVRTFSFSSGEARWTPDGEASNWLTSELRPDQAYPLGRNGRFVNSYLPPDGDLPTGRLVSPPFVIEGELMTFVIGGSKAAESEHVELWVGEQPVRRATGCNSEWMGRRVWNVSKFRGRTARLVIADGSTGHVLVDEIVEWKNSRQPAIR